MPAKITKRLWEARWLQLMLLADCEYRHIRPGYESQKWKGARIMEDILDKAGTGATITQDSAMAQMIYAVCPELTPPSPWDCNGLQPPPSPPEYMQACNELARAARRLKGERDG